VVVERLAEPVTITIKGKGKGKGKGKDITRNASDNEPAYLIEQHDGDQVLKSESELTVGG
jgi:hypothetical protein